MKPLLSALLIAILAATPLTGFAQTRVISDLSEGALLGPVDSTSALQRDFATHQTLIAAAAQRLTLSSADYRTIGDAVRDGHVQYVTIPRHLDAMAGSYRGRAFVVRDVTIPAGVHGWEVDLHHSDALLRVFVPNPCGNISYVRIARPYTLAAAPRVVSAPAATPMPAPVAVATVAPIAPPPAETSVPALASSPAPVVPDAPLVAAPAVHHATALPWLLLGLAALAIAHPKVPSIDIPRNRCRPHG